MEMNRRDAEAPREDGVTGEIIGAAIEVHRELGPGLLESAYEYHPSSAFPRLGGRHSTP
jgi:hypothetical protein